MRRQGAPDHLRIRDLTKRFGALHRAEGHLARGRSRASSSASSGPPAAARPRCCARSPGSTSRPAGTIEFRPAATSRNLPPAAARLRHRVPVLRAVPEPDGRRQRRLWPGQPRLAAARDRRRASPNCCSWSACPIRARSTRRSSPAASSSASRWRARWRLSPALLLLDEPLSALDARVRVRLRERDQDAAAAPRRHHHHGHARPGRGADDGRPHRRHEPRRDRAGRHADRGLPQAGDARSSPISSAR